MKAERILDNLIKYGNRTYNIIIYIVGSAPMFISQNIYFL